MSDNSAPLPWKHVAKTLRNYAPLWGGTALLFACLGLCAAMFSRDYWSASQPLVLRDEATGSVERLGRFGSQTQLKAAQETILEMARNHEVVLAALKSIGPENGDADADWPSTDYVSGVASKRINVRAPQGSEFGNTEVIYLQVEATSPERAEQFCSAVYTCLSKRLRSVRHVRAESLMNELVQARDLAKEKLDEVAVRLKAIEVDFGSDLSDLRNLSETFGDGTNRRALDETIRDLQAAELELEQLEALHALLVEGRENPQKLVVSGGDLLSSQPSLLTMKDGMIQAQLQKSQLSGRYTASHPRLRAAVETENEIRQQLQTEAAAVIEAMQPSLQLGRDKVARLRTKQQMLTKRLERIALVRTDYAQLAAEVKHRMLLLEQAEKALTEAQASRASATSVNLLAELGPPLVGDHPIGASGGLMTVGAGSAGLLFGLGAVFLIAPGPNQRGRGRRWSDIIGGRRASDQATSNVAAQPAAAGFPGDRRAAQQASASPLQGEPSAPAPVPVGPAPVAASPVAPQPAMREQVVAEPLDTPEPRGSVAENALTRRLAENARQARSPQQTISEHVAQARADSKAIPQATQAVVPKAAANATPRSELPGSTMSFKELSSQLGTDPASFPGDRRKNQRD